MSRIIWGAAAVAGLCGWALAAPGGAGAATAAVGAGEVKWKSSLPLADPVVDAEAVLSAQRTSVWENQGQADVQRMLLEGDVRVQVGAYGFRAARVVVHHEMEKLPGGTVHHLAFYLDKAEALQGAGTIQAEGGRLLVTVSTRGGVRLKTDVKNEEAREADALVVEARGRVERYLKAIAHPVLPMPAMEPIWTEAAQTRRQEMRRQLGVEMETRLAARQTEMGLGAGISGGSGAAGAEAAGRERGAVVGILESVQIMPRDGTVDFSPPDKFTVEKIGENETGAAMVGNVRIMYQSADGTRTMSLQAENAVVISSGTPEQLAERKLEAAHVKGIYLEGNVIATDGDYTVRAPRMYYDLEKNKAILLEAVLYTWDVQKRIPIYLRAAQLRQESRTSFEARQAILTTSEFGEPHFAIGANRVTFAQVRDENGGSQYRFTAEDSTFKFMHVPVFYWPQVEGTAEKTALQRLQVGFSSKTGIKFETKWDLFALADKTPPTGVKASGRVDFLGEHGPATGLDVNYERPTMFGNLEAYLLAWDSGTDGIAERTDIEHDGEQRGKVNWRHRQYLPENWQLSLELGYASDPTLLEELYREEAQVDKQWETSAYLKKQEDDWAFSILAGYDVNDFTTQMTTLQSPGYVVDKLPELGYYQVGTSLWEDRLTYFSETRVSRMQIHAGRDKPADRGFTDAQSLKYFGFASNVRFMDAVESIYDVPTDWRYRADSRHEVNMPLKVATVDVTPYVAGRVTAYDDHFEEYSGEDQSVRFMGQAGARFHTQFHKVDDAAESRVLDLHRLRHVVEPGVDVYRTFSNMNMDDIPVYDDDVERLSDGFGVRAGVRNTWQTQRGGPNDWRDVDWLVVDTDVIHRSANAPVDAYLARFYSYRPEYSLGGNHFHSSVLWAVTQNLATAMEFNHNFDTEQLAMARVGVTLAQDPRIKHGFSYVDIDPLGEKLLQYDFMCQLTATYAVSATYTYDVVRGESREVRGALERKIPGWRLIFLGRYDLAEDEQFIGFQLSPEGLSTAGYITPAGLPEE